MSVQFRLPIRHFSFRFLLLLALAPLLLIKLSEALSDLDTDRRDSLEFRLKRRETSSLIKKNDGVSNYLIHDICMARTIISPISILNMEIYFIFFLEKKFPS